MKFSVLIALYNKAPYIANTIASVLAQTFTDFEVVVVDDGSTDNGAVIVASFTDPRLRLVRQPNAGVSAARNLGISLAKGEWIAFLDADDWHHPDHLATLVMAQDAFPLADTVATSFIGVADSEGPWPPRWPAISADPEVELVTDLPTRWMSGQSFFTSSVAARRARLKSMQPCFAVGEWYGEDLDMWFKLAEKTPIALVKSPLAAYRIEVQGSLTAHQAELHMSPYLYRMQERALSGGMTPAQARSALWLVAQLEVSVARRALVQGNRLECLRWLIRGRRAMAGKRWWMTAAMALLFSGKLTKTWQSWRVNRTVHPIDTPDAG